MKIWKNGRKFKRCEGWIHKFQHLFNERKVQTVKRQKKEEKWSHGNIKESIELLN